MHSPTPQRRRIGAHRKLMAASAALVGALLLASCAPPAAPPEAELNIAGPNYCRLDGAGGVSPIWATSDGAIGLSYETLLWNNGAGEGYSPRLATSWTIAPDNTSITFELREDAKFADGEVFNAEAVKTWIDYRASAAGAQYGLGYIGEIVSVDVLGEFTVKVTLAAPNPVLEFVFSQTGINWGGVASPKAVAEALSTEDSPVWTEGTYGAGPYMLDPEQSVVGELCTYVPNPNYYDQSKITWAKITTRPVLDANALLAALKTGQVDIGQTGNGAIAESAEQDGLTLHYAKNLSVALTLVDRGGLNPALADVRVRQALNYAIDREAITAALYPNSGTPSSDPVPAGGGLDGYDEEFYDFYAYDPDKASELLDEAGYAEGLTISVLTAQGGFGFGLDQLAQSVCKYWADINVECALNNAPGASFNSERFESKAYSAVATIEGTPATWIWFNNYMKPGGYGSDQHGFVDAKSIELWEEGSELPREEAEAVWREIHNRFIEEAFSIPIGSPGVLWVVSPRVSGLELGNTGSSVLDWSPSPDQD